MSKICVRDTKHSIKNHLPYSGNGTSKKDILGNHTWRKNIYMQLHVHINRFYAHIKTKHIRDIS